jgi:heterodisulfide reductase subunit B
MSYKYYPGCSLGSTGKAYDESSRYVFKTLGAPLEELDDWNCCGATAYMAVSELQAVALSARNLAIAEKQGNGKGPVEVVAPCAACYLGLVKAQHFLQESEEVQAKVNKALGAAKLHYGGNVKVRHPLDVLVNDIGLDKVAAAVKNPLKGLKVASYYGCQIVRPFSTFDDQFNPTCMDKLMKAAGAEVIDWPLKTRCCGASLTGTIQEVGLRLSWVLLREAKKRKADIIVTACPLCQFNLECFQPKMKSWYGEDVSIPVAYFTQVLGLAMGGSRRELGTGRLFVPLEPTLKASKKEGVPHVNA